MSEHWYDHIYNADYNGSQYQCSDASYTDWSQEIGQDPQYEDINDRSEQA
jgi:hypothetical protein